MTVRSDIDYTFPTSPRVAEVDIASTEFVVQDIVDSFRVTSADVGGSGLDGIDDKQLLVDATGKDDLGGDVEVGITATGNDVQIAFQARTTPASSGTVTTGDSNGINYIDTGGTLIADGVVRGYICINFTDQSMCSVISVEGEGLATTNGLTGGLDNQFDIGDDCKFYEVEQCEISGGNWVATDSVGDPMDAILPTFGTQIVRTSASSATTQNQLALEAGLFNGGVTVDVVNGEPGTAGLIGILSQPSDNIPDARTIATERGLDKFFIIGNITLDTGDDVSDIHVVGHSHASTIITINPGCVCDNTEFLRATITGILDGGSFLFDCSINALDFVNGHIHNCMLNLFTITLGGGGDCHFVDCVSGVPGTDTSTIDMGGSGQSLGVRGYNGGIRLINKSGVDNVSLDMSSGNVILDSTVTNGDIVIRGIATLTDNSVGANVLADSLMNPENISDNVWNKVTADHTTDGTFGGELATKADIQAAASTIVVTADSGTIIEGSLVSGSYSSTLARDGTYWQILEDGSNGLTVEFIFSMATKTCRPGVFEVFGRYEGNPANVHYQELWAWNVESGVFEQLVEVFMPGGNTSDDTFTHEYFERHINRTTDEVKIRTVHNVISYNGSHNIYFDLVTLSCIEVITAEDMAIAVWEEPTADHTTVGTFGGDNDQLKKDIVRMLGLANENVAWSNMTWDTSVNPPRMLTGKINLYTDQTKTVRQTDSQGNIVYQVTQEYEIDGRTKDLDCVRTI